MANHRDHPTDADRYPTLTEHGRRMLDSLREHPHAPIFRNTGGNRLRAEDVEQVRAFEREVLAAQPGWPDGAEPAWLGDYVARCLEVVPFYRGYGSPPSRFDDLPTTDRGDLACDIARFVPDDVPLDDLINFRTSGTTGHPLLVASHPVVAASYLAFHKRALRRFGVELRHGRGQVGVVLLGWQTTCFTYVSVTPTMDESGYVKLNLHPADWRDPDDRARYLDSLDTEVYAGDPISFAELLRLPLRTRPRALLSTSMALLPALRARLEERFGCPVLDLYSLNEAGPVAVYDATAGGHVLLQHRLYVEVLDDHGRPVSRGDRGEVTLSGGFNPWLPLLRYRTGDYAALRVGRHEPVLVELEGRPPVLFRTMAGLWLNNIEVTHALKGCAIPQWTLHQNRDGSLRVGLPSGSFDRHAVSNALLALFGPGQRLTAVDLDTTGGKRVQYTSNLGGVES